MKLLVLMGSPGSGKGTLSNLLVENHGFKHLSTGKIFRKLSATASSSVDKNTLSQGNFVSDDITNNLIKDEINKLPSDSMVILDGYPRTIAQAEFLDANFAVWNIVYLDNISNDVIVSRLCNRCVCEQNDHSFNMNDLSDSKHCPIDGSNLFFRPDDSETVVRKRLQTYRDNTLPVIEWYDSKGRLKRCDACATSQRAYEELVTLLSL